MLKQQQVKTLVQTAHVGTDKDTMSIQTAHKQRFGLTIRRLTLSIAVKETLHSYTVLAPACINVPALNAAVTYAQRDAAEFT